MKLSVIVPMYNSSLYIEEMMQSFISIDKDKVEVILIDDGSTDITSEICKRYLNKYSNMKLYINTNHGVSYSRNFGLDKITGDYVIFVDSDDRLDCNWYSKIVKVIFESPDNDIYFFSNGFVEENCDAHSLVESIIGFKNMYSNCYLPTPWSKVYRTIFLKDNNICFNDSIIHGEDALFNLEVIFKSKSIKLVNDSFYFYRINSFSATHRYNSDFLISNRNYLFELKNLLASNYGEENAFVQKAINYSFQNSMYIFAGKVSKLESFNEIKRAISDLYSNEYYCSMLKNSPLSKELSKSTRIVYEVVKLRLLIFLEIVLFLIRKKKVVASEKWIKV